MVKLGLFFLAGCFFSPYALSATKLGGYFRTEELIYPTKLPGTTNLNESLQISSQIRYLYYSPNWENGLQMGIFGDVNANVVQPAVHEIYTSYVPDKSKSHWVAGRKLEFWSKVDQDWQLGLWQPQNKFDSLRAEDQGLTGFFFKHDEGKIHFMAFASPLYLPTTNPEVKAKDGKLVSDGRWYRSPSQTFSLFGQETQIVYSLDIPDAAKLVSNPGGGLRMLYGEQDKGFWASVNYGYKPINVLLLQYKKSLFLPDKDPQTGEVTVSPAVGYHSIYGLDAGYRFESISVSASILQDQPNHKIPESPYVLQNPESMTATSVHIDTEIPLPFLSQPVKVNVDYLNITGGKIRDFDSQDSAQGAIFDQRFDFMNAASIGGEISSRIFNRPLVSSVKFTREFEQKGSLLNAELNYYPRPFWGLVLGMDLLGVDDDSATNRDTRFLNQFRANDRYYGGISYVF
jgi:hypothetical protein